MVQAAHHIDLSYMPGQEGADRAAIYRAMIAAAPQPAVQQWNDLIGQETHADADGLLVWRDEVDFAIPTPQADSQPAPVLGTIAHVGTGKTTLTGAITSALRAASTEADNVTAPAGGAVVTDDMVLAALRMQYPGAYGQYLRHPANGPKTSLRTESEIDTARRMIVAALSAAPTPPAQPQAGAVPLTDREIELIDGMIQVQLDHASRCDAIANRSMADKQKGWDMERVALLQKFKAHGIKGGQHGTDTQSN